MIKIKYILYLIPALPHIIAYLFMHKEKINLDLQKFCKIHYGKPIKPNIWYFYKEIVGFKEFRSVFYMRVGYISKIIKFLLPPMTLLSFGLYSKKIGGGIFIQHGYCTDIQAESIGENVWINQRVTIGFRGNGQPIIGNNVRIGTGAVILGKITIGNNVNIGANAIVIKDVPDNCTVCSPAATIVKYHKYI